MSDRDFPAIPSARITHIDELAKLPLSHAAGTSVRVLGRIESFDVATNIAVAVYHSAKMPIATDRLSTSMTGGFNVAALFQFLGELEVRQGKLVLNARIAIPMAGLSTELWDSCLQLRRDFEERCL